MHNRPDVWTSAPPVCTANVTSPNRLCCCSCGRKGRPSQFDPKPAAFMLWDSSGRRQVSETSATTSLLVWNQTATIGFLVRETAMSLTACSLVPGNACAVGHDGRGGSGRRRPRALACSRSTLCGRGRPFFEIPPVVAKIPGCFLGEAM